MIAADYYYLVWIITAPLFGLLIGSFLNVCIYRLPRHETVVKGHSYCPSCHHNLAAGDLIPVFSYLFLGRKCRYCRAPISPRYALIETWTGLYCFLAAWFWRSPDLDHGISLSWLQLSAAITNWLPVFILSAAAMLMFFILLIWAMLLKARQVPSPFLYVWLIIPIAARFALQPSRLPSHLVSLVMACAFYGLLLILRLVPAQQPLRRLHECAGLAAIGFFGGLPAAQATGLVYIIGLSLLALLQGKGRYHRSVSDELKTKIENIYLTLPPTALTAASVVWLILD